MTKFNEHLKFGERDHDYRGHTGHRFDASPTSPMHGDPVAPGGGQSAPLDGGLSLLLAAGIGLGVKKARDKRVALKQQARA